MISIDKFFFKTYNRKLYNCAHLACEVWFEMTGEDLSEPMQGFLKGRGETKAVLSDLRKFKRLKKAVSPCFVLFQTPRVAPHVGIYIRGKVLHIQPRGVEFQPLDVAAAGFKKAGFFTWQTV